MLGEVLELGDTNAVDAPPLWLYAEYSDYVALDSSDYFQWAGAVYQCNDYNAIAGNCAEVIYTAVSMCQSYYCDPYNSNDLANIASAFSFAGIEKVRNEPYYEDWEYWSMDIDWWNPEEVLDFVAEENIFCDWVKDVKRAETDFGASGFAGYPWWWGAVYCLPSFK